ncbi:MAG TPA: hypothetical protein VMZ69_08185, partial [Saprospiraceae bacterium]|nr:hypothetical protein [Saprospiraceae bacterium]
MIIWKFKLKNMNCVYRLIYLWVAVVLISGCQTRVPSKSSVDKFDNRIDSVLALMTLDEKIGQMTLFTTDWGSTGPTIREGYEEDIRSGRCGALFNSHTAAFTRRLQKIAVEESR